jgi:hypothetical protein
MKFMKFKNPKKSIIYLILLVLVAPSLVFYRGELTAFSLGHSPLSIVPKSSENSIKLLTPKNVTYNKAMYGYYPGSNSFEQDLEGEAPSWFDIVDTDGGSVEVISSLDDHYKVMELHDSTVDDCVNVTKALGAKPLFGTIEYWMRTDDANKTFSFNLVGGVDFVNLISIRTWSSKLQFFNGTWNNITSIQDDTWVNIRIDFDGSILGFQGLIQYTWRISVDGITYGDFLYLNDRGFTQYIKYYTDCTFGQSDYSYYIDAIGFSWNTYYSVGNNINPGLFLNFEAPSNLTWIGYSFDGNSNITILGPYVIPFPNGNGIHSVQIFGNDSENNVYQSEKRYFTVDKPSLLLLHGAGGDNSSFEEFFTDRADWNRNGISDFLDYYGTGNVISLKSYFDINTDRPEFDGITKDPMSSIENMSRAVKNYILNDHESGILKDDLDLLGYSLGGLVIRQMIKAHYYELIHNGVTIQHVSILGSPSRGAWGYNVVYLNKSKSGNYWTYETTRNCKASLEMVTISDFIAELNADDETPHDIIYNTYRGTDVLDGGWAAILLWPGYFNLTLINQIASIIGTFGDGYVAQGSVVLDGALNNRAFYKVTHGDVTGLSERYFVLQQIVWDLRYYVSPHLELKHPQNTTYNSPTHGYYRSTIGFDGDENGLNPSGCSIFHTIGGTAKVIDSLGDHRKVVELHDTSDDTHADVGTTFYFNRPNGTIEYWMRTNDAEKLSGFHLLGGILLQSLINTRVRFNQFQYNNGTDWRVITSMESDHWYHIRIDFECTTGGYLGLSQHQWNLYIDGIKFGPYPFAHNWNYAKQIIYYTDFLYGLSGYSYYIDAIGLSWYGNYDIGDNLQQGFLIDIETTYQPKLINYSLDGSTDVTISGDAVIPFPSEDLHSLQISTEDLNEEIIQSDLRYFSIDITPPWISISSPSSSEYFGEDSPPFEVSLDDPSGIDTMWYTLDNGITNITFSEESGTIDQDEWDDIVSSGPVTIRFYTNDSTGLENYAEVTVNKDIDPPSSTISFTPHSGNNIINKTTEFTIDAEDISGSGVSLIQYKIDDSAWIDYTGPFDLSSYSYGDYTIAYRATDAVGNIESEHSLQVKLEEIPSEKPKIYGFNMWVILSLLGITSILLIRKYWRSMKHNK